MPRARKATGTEGYRDPRQRDEASLPRRGFLARAGAVLALPAFLPRARSASPAEQVVTGHVGVGGRGSALLGQAKGHSGVRVAAVCDVDARHRDRARQAAGVTTAAYRDFRRLLEREDLDAVICATPDHWHAGVTIAACRAGKDVYVEKPASYTVEEGRAMVQAAREHERVVQVGTHHRSERNNREIARIVRGGRIGRVREVRCWMWANKHAPRTPPEKPPEALDWDFWLGPAPAVAYHPDRCHYSFRWCRDYAGGYMTDWGVHMLDLVALAMDIDRTSPESVEAKGFFARDNLYDYPLSFDARWEFRDPDWTLRWTQPAEGGDVLFGEKYGMTFYGEDGELRTGFGSGKHAFFRDGEEAPLPREGEPVDIPETPSHLQNWVDRIRDRGRPVADIEIGHRTNTNCLLANIALFSGRGRLRWDGERERFVDDPEADGWLSRTPRERWAI